MVLNPNISHYDLASHAEDCWLDSFSGDCDWNMPQGGGKSQKVTAKVAGCL